MDTADVTHRKNTHTTTTIVNTVTESLMCMSGRATHLEVVHEVVGDLHKYRAQHAQRVGSVVNRIPERRTRLHSALTAGAAAACLAEAMIAKWASYARQSGSENLRHCPRCNVLSHSPGVSDKQAGHAPPPFPFPLPSSSLPSSSLPYRSPGRSLLGSSIRIRAVRHPPKFDHGFWQATRSRDPARHGRGSSCRLHAWKVRWLKVCRLWRETTRSTVSACSIKRIELENFMIHAHTVFYPSSRFNFILGGE